METVVLRYGCGEFRAQAKRLLNQNEDFDVLICGWRARIILRSMTLLESMQGEEKGTRKLGTLYAICGLARLQLLTPFMTVFWLAVANNRVMHLQNSCVDCVQLAFRQKN